MAKTNKKKTGAMDQKLIAVFLLVAACVLIVFLTGGRNRLEEVVINRLPGQYRNVSDEEIIRSSGLKMGAQISSIAEMEAGVEAGVNATGLVKYESMQRVARKCIEITVSPREAIAVINSAGNYVLIDRDGTVMEILSSLPTDDLLYVTGVDIHQQEKGRKFTVKKQAQLDTIINISLAVRNGGYSGVYSELNVKDVKGIYLVTNTSLIVEIFDGSGIERSLQIADEIMREGKTKGKITISGNYGSYKPPEGS